MDNWDLDENHLISDNNYNIVDLYSPQELQGIVNNVGETTPQFTIRIGDAEFYN